MATETIVKQHTASLNVYICVNNEAGSQFFDFSDNTFKALASCTTPYVACTERTDAGGAGLSLYVATVTLANLNNTGLPLKATVTAYVRSGGSPAPLTDLIISPPKNLDVQFGELGIGELRCQFEAAMTSSAGSAVRLLGWLERNGVRVVLASGTCTWTFREHGSGSDLFTVTDSAPNGDGIFEAAQSSPGFTDDRLYEVTIDIVDSGTNTWTTTHAIPVIG